jgi:hypothetical protein
MANATLIPPAQEPKAPPPLDTKEPMRTKVNKRIIKFLAQSSNGQIAAEKAGGDGELFGFDPSELENFEHSPKRTMSRDVVVVEGYEFPLFASAVSSVGADKVRSRAKVTYTEGEGWAVEEAQS